ncbi:MAG: tyrosine-type recombinase/integrase [Bdellovibrionales bacterium]|nr:tyrosine-type recombinase/integrase [Bdellovibrionales bacterium]
MALEYWVEFFDDLQNVRGRSQNTVLAYRRDLELFDEFYSQDKNISKIYNFLKDKKLSPRSQARVISSIRSYFKFLESKGKEIPELRELRPPKVKTALPKAITFDEFNKLLDAARVNCPYKTSRNQITLLMLFGLGCRVTELINMNLQDYNLTESWLCITGKGGKQRLIPLTDKLNEELEKYLVHSRKQIIRDKTDSILINDRGRRPSRVDIWRWLAQWSKKAGFENPISPHQFRHGCATALLEGGADLRAIQTLLGHSSIQTTQIYTSVSSKHLREEVDEHHPLSKL